MRRPIIAGNWKLNKSIREAIDTVTLLKRQLADVQAVDIVVCPVYTAIADVAEVLSETAIKVGAQDVYWEDKGAYTGEVSAPLLKEAGAQYVVIGHSERRQFFHETHETVNKKTRAALKAGLTPIVCVGELLSEREAGRTFGVVGEQLKGGLAGFTADDLKQIVLAYEPVWAIGTGKVATPQQAQEVHAFIRKQLTEGWGAEVAQAVRIQYGGSVKPDNIAELMREPDIDGALVGGASLEAGSFADIVKNAVVVGVR
ncbi:MAG: Bifunctional PGK/TIM [Candidatus Omnitrophica bacterium]|nr:Bifunctional PGK/TIM [Candidatus Omnitrophota bacterium]